MVLIVVLDVIAVMFHHLFVTKRRLRHPAGMWMLSLVLMACHATPPTSQPFACENPVKGCTFTHQTHAITMQFDQTPIPLKPFHLDIRSDVPLHEAHVSLAMEGMDMGLNQYRLMQVDAKHWTAEIILPVCIRGRADWKMELALVDAQGEARYRTTFLSQSP